MIMVDAYQDITIPFQMSSVEFFTMVKDHLKDGGVMGECHLGKYVSGDKERHDKVRCFLEEMGW